MLKAAEYSDAKDLSVIAIGKKLSKQAFNIINKIREVNNYLLSSQNAGYTIREIHPELCFWGLNKRQPMKHSKKCSAGFEERLTLLENHLSNGRDLTNRALIKFKRSDVAKDDILDALVGMVVASTFDNKLKTLPATPQLDSRGIPMEIVYTEQPNNYTL